MYDTAGTSVQSHSFGQLDVRGWKVPHLRSVELAVQINAEGMAVPPDCRKVKGLRAARGQRLGASALEECLLAPACDRLFTPHTPSTSSTLIPCPPFPFFRFAAGHAAEAPTAALRAARRAVRGGALHRLFCFVAHADASPWISQPSFSHRSFWSFQSWQLAAQPWTPYS